MSQSTLVKEHTMTYVTLTGDDQLAGKYIVTDTREDGSMVIRPESESDADLRAIGARPATPEEVDAIAEQLGVLPPDGEG
jgi:hypothetical protein